MRAVLLDVGITFSHSHRSFRTPAGMIGRIDARLRDVSSLQQFFLSLGLFPPCCTGVGVVTNGVGKSSIPLIIEEVLYNKNSKGIKKSDIPNRYVDAGYSICLEFSKDSDEYVVSVVRKTSLKVSLKKNGEEISSHTATNTYKTIQEIIGVDFKTFSQLVYQNTNASLQFLTATDANRKRFLIDLLHLEEYTKLFEIFKEEARNAATTLVQEQTKINTYESWLKDNTLEDSDILPLKKVENNLEEAEIELRDLAAELKNISEKNSRILNNNNLLNVLELNEKKLLELEEFTEVQDVSELTETFWADANPAAGSAISP